MEILRSLCLAAFLNLCCALEIPCNVTQTARGTIYRVPEFQAVTCDYQWANATGHVMANQKGKIDDLVLNSSARGVMTCRCLAQLNYTRDCISEGIQRTAYCVSDCMNPGPPKKKEMPRNYWNTVVSISVMVLVLLGCICSAVTRRNNPPIKGNVEAV